MTETVRHDSAPPYRQAVDAVISALGTDAQHGLSETEARTRLERAGRNELTEEEPAPGWKKYALLEHGIVDTDCGGHVPGEVFRRGAEL